MSSEKLEQNLPYLFIQTKGRKSNRTCQISTCADRGITTQQTAPGPLTKITIIVEETKNNQQQQCSSCTVKQNSIIHTMSLTRIMSFAATTLATLERAPKKPKKKHKLHHFRSSRLIHNQFTFIQDIQQNARRSTFRCRRRPRTCWPPR